MNPPTSPPWKPESADEHLRLLLAAVEQSPASVVVTDTRGTIVYVNPKVSRVTGYAPEEVLGRNVRLMKSGEQSRDFYRNLWQTVLAGNEWRGEFHNKKKSGELFWEHASISPVRNDDGTITHFLAVKEDVTERKAADEELRLAKEAAEAAIRAKDAFLANMSHELRTPLNAINGVAQTLLEQDQAPELRPSLELIRKAGQDLLEIIQEVLCFSGLQAGKVHLEERSFALLPVIMHALQFAVEAARSKALEVDYWIDPDVPAEIIGDPQRLQQVLVNILGNSVKFTQSGRVHLAVRKSHTEDGRIKLGFVVTDTGIGISPDALSRLFQPFTQADETITRRFGGTGLGLVISRSLARMMGGDLVARSRVGRGTTFRCDILVNAAPNTHRILETRTPDTLAGITVGLLEPRTARRALLREMLASAGANGIDMTAKNPPQPATWTVLVDATKPPLVRVSSGRGDQLSDALQRLAFPFSPDDLAHAVLLCTHKTRETRSPVARAERIGDKLPLRILVADDIRTNLETLRMIFRHLGYTDITLVENGALALDAFTKQDYDFVVLDLHMPVMDGLAAAREMRCREKSTGKRSVIVALTASTLQHDRDLCLSAGMDDFLTKPILPASLVSTLQRAFATRLSRPVASEGTANTAPARPASETSKQPYFDEDRLRLLTEAATSSGCPEMVSQMADTFKEDMQTLLPAMVAACQLRDRHALQSLVHGAKGGALTVGWSRLGLRCNEVLGQLRNGTFSAWETWPAEFQTLAAETDKAWKVMQLAHAWGGAS